MQYVIAFEAFCTLVESLTAASSPAKSCKSVPTGVASKNAMSAASTRRTSARCRRRAAAFAPAAGVAAAGAAARSDVVVMAAKKKGVNPALFATGIAKKEAVRGGGRKPLKAGTGQFRETDGSWKGNKPWLAGKKAEAAKVKNTALSGALGSKEGRGGGMGILFLGGGRSK